MSKNTHPDTPLWEKLTGFVGFVLIALMLSYLAWSAFSASESPPLIEFEITDIQAIPNQHVVYVVVRNRGDQVAMSLNVEASLELADGSIEQSGASVDYLPIQSDQALGFYFRNDPAEGELAFRALNFQIP